MERCRLDFMSPCSKNPDRPLDYVTHRRLLKVRIVFVWPVSHEWDDFRVMSQCPSLTDAYSEAESSVLMFCSAKWFLPPAKAVVLKYHLGRMVSGDCWQNCNWSWKRFLWCVSIQLQMLNWGPRRQLHVLALSWISWAWTRRIEEQTIQLPISLDSRTVQFMNRSEINNAHRPVMSGRYAVKINFSSTGLSWNTWKRSWSLHGHQETIDEFVPGSEDLEPQAACLTSHPLSYIGHEVAHGHVSENIYLEVHLQGTSFWHIALQTPTGCSF